MKTNPISFTVVYILTYIIKFGICLGNITDDGTYLWKVRQAHILAADVLDRVYEIRHKRMIDQINALTDNELSGGRDSAYNTLRMKLNSTTVHKAEKEVIEKQLNLLSAAAPDTMKDYLISAIQNEKKFNTIALLMNNASVTIAGKIQSNQIHLPDSIRDLKVWTDAINKKFRVSFDKSDMGFQLLDYIVINEAVTDLMKEPVRITLVDIQREVGAQISKESIDQYEKERMVDAEIDKLQNVEAQQKYIDLFQQSHAEIQLLKIVKATSFIEGGVIVASNPPYASCDNKLNCIAHFDESGNYNDVHCGGEEVRIANVQKWEHPKNIDVKEIILTPELLELASTETALASTTDRPPCSCFTSSRRKRSPSKSCIFVFEDSEEAMGKTSKRKSTGADISKIKSREFISEYARTDNLNRRTMTNAAENNFEKVSGEVVEVKKVSKVIEYEKWQKHVAKVDHFSRELGESGGLLDKTGQTKGYENHELTRNTKLSPAKTASALARKSNKFGKAAGKVSGAVGEFFLARSIVRGITHGDTTSLAIIGGRVGGGALLGGLSKYGTTIATKVGTKIGIKLTTKIVVKGLKFMGKVAAPLGAAVDIGLSAWSLSNAINRLNAPGATKYEQNAAIADIVDASLDIAITAVVTIASIAFPKLAPVFMTIGFYAQLLVTIVVEIYKAQNHVDSLNSQIKLLEFEKSVEFGRYFAGLDTSAYLDHLIKTKFANNFVVESAVRNLGRSMNEQYMGLVFPSQKVNNCRLELWRCTYYVFKFGCDEEATVGKTVAWNCYDQGECTDPHSAIPVQCKTNEGIYDGLLLQTGKVFWDKWKCICGGGESRPNNMVDFRSKKTIYIERSSPDPPKNNDFNLKCVPSSLHDEGYKVSERDSHSGYLCENAIGLTRGRGKHMLYDLQDGTDQIYLDSTDSVDNHYIVGDGHKIYRGNAGVDTFIINGPCKILSGVLDGKEVGKDNIVQINEACSPGNDVEIVFEYHNYGYIEISSPYQKIKLNNIQRVFGRKGERDILSPACGTKLAALGGGRNSYSPDLIQLSSSFNCSTTMLEVGAEGSTTVVSTTTHFAIFRTLVQDDSNGRLNFRTSLRLTPKLLALFGLNLEPKEILQLVDSKMTTDDDLTTFFNKISLSRSRELTFEFTIERVNIPPGYLTSPEVSFLSNNNDTNSSILFSSDSGVPYVRHNITTSSRKTFFGAIGLHNIFLLNECDKSIYGGNMDDSFLLLSDSFTGMMFGGQGINAIIINETLLVGKILEIDLPRNYIRGFLKDMISFKDIQAVIARSGQGDTIICDCDTKYVSGEGGENVRGDNIIIPNNLTCTVAMNLTISVELYTNVENFASHGIFTYSIKGNIFNINIANIENTTNIYEFDYGIDKIVSVVYNAEGRTLNLGLVSGQKFTIQFFTGDRAKFESLETDVNSEITVDPNSGELHTVIRIGGEYQEEIIGIANSANEFIVNSRILKKVTGGNLYNIFWLESVEEIYELNGRSKNDRNSLIISNQFYSQSNVYLNLSTSTINNATHSVVHSIQNVYKFDVRRSGFDAIEINCDTIGVSNFDQILITDTNCTDYSVTFQIGQNTSVHFKPLQYDSNNRNIFNENSTFYYRFDSPRSFDSTVDLWYEIRETIQIMYLPLNVTDLSEIWFDDFVLFYVYKDQVFNHSIDPYLEMTQEFYSQPNFMTHDGFEIKITRYGEILFSFYTYANITLDHIQNQVVRNSVETSNLLGVSFLIKSGYDYVHISNSDTNVIVNVEEGRSHLCSLGKNSTHVYTILSLVEDVYIYLGHSQGQVHTLDLTELIWTIRQFTKSKYVPKILQISSSNFIISMEGHYPGNIYLLDGVDIVDNIQILLNSVVMKLSEFSGAKIEDEHGIVRRSVYPIWSLVPNPIVLDEGSVVILSTEDFEDGQEIVYNYNVSTKLIQNSNQIILTNIVNNNNNSDQLFTFVLLDAVENMSGLDYFQNLTIRVGNVTMNLENSSVLQNLVGIQQTAQDWEDLVEEAELFLLEELPEITPQFQLSLFHRLWKRHRTIVLLVVIVIIVITLLVIAVWLIIFDCFVSRRGKYVVNEKVEFELHEKKPVQEKSGEPDCMK